LVIPNHRNKESDQYLIKPGYLRAIVAGISVLLVAAAAGLVIFVPLADELRGRDIDLMREQAISNSLRIQQLEDSLRAQHEYAAVVAGLLGLQTTIVNEEETEIDQPDGIDESTPLHPSESPPVDWTDHEQPAVPVDRMAVILVTAGTTEETTRGYLSGLQLPFRPPVDGFVTRSFSARDGHFAVDIAVAAGSLVRSVGDGHVIVADWGYDGGWTVAVHHADGYVSVYKHNDRLLKRVGERVLDQEPVAISGNSGEITTGPHIHFELWHEGLAQDPERYFLK
jgi:murein DD-endopeptidase MepM/ murein hydrolase activator NlpD